MHPHSPTHFQGVVVHEYWKRNIGYKIPHPLSDHQNYIHASTYPHVWVYSQFNICLYPLIKYNRTITLSIYMYVKKNWIVVRIDAMQTPLALSFLTLSGKKIFHIFWRTNKYYDSKLMKAACFIDKLYFCELFHAQPVHIKIFIKFNCDKKWSSSSSASVPVYSVHWIRSQWNIQR